MTMRHSLNRLAGIALALSLTLTAACTTVDRTPIEEIATPQAPGGGFAAEAPAPAPAAEATPLPAAPQAPPPTPAPTPGRITPREKYVNVRPAPSTNNRPVAVLMGGKKVEILEEQETWVKIRWTRGRKTLEGWVARKFVEAD